MISWTVLNFLAASFATFSKGSFILAKAHCETFTSSHHSVRVSFIASFHLLQALSGWRFQLPLTLCSCLPFFFGLLSKPFDSCSFLAEMFSHFSYVEFFSHHFPQPSTMRLVLHKLIPLPIRLCFFLFFFQMLVVTLLANIGRV